MCRNLTAEFIFSDIFFERMYIFNETVKTIPRVDEGSRILSQRSRE